MIKYLLLCITCIAFYSCELKEQPIVMEDAINDSTLVPMDSTMENPIFEFNSFSASPYPMSDCLCNFSITKTVFQNEQYIFASAIEEKSRSFMQFNGEWVEFELDSIGKIKDSITLMSVNDSLQITILAKKDSVTVEKTLYQGELQINKKGEDRVFKTNIYGSCE